MNTCPLSVSALFCLLTVFSFNGWLPETFGQNISDEFASIRADLYALNGARAQERVSAVLRSPGLNAEQKKEAQRLQEFALGLIDWNQWVVARFSRLSSGEIQLGDTEAYIVEASSQELTIQVGGQTVICKPDRVPRKIAEFLVRKRLADPRTQRIFGIYLCMYPRGDRAKARQLWDFAQQKRVDCSALYAELNVPIPASVVNSMPGPQVVTAPAGSNRTLADLNNPAFLPPEPVQKPNPGYPSGSVPGHGAFNSTSTGPGVNPVSTIPMYKPTVSPAAVSMNPPVTSVPLVKPSVPSVAVSARQSVSGRPSVSSRPNRSGKTQYPPKVKYLY